MAHVTILVPPSARRWIFGAAALALALGCGRRVEVAAPTADEKPIEQVSATIQERAILKGHGHGVGSAAFSQDGKTLYSASADGTVRVWQTDGTERARWPNLRASLKEMMPQNAGAGTFTKEFGDGSVEIKTTDGRTFYGVPINSVVVAPDGKTVAAGDAKGRVSVWDSAAGKLKTTWQAPPGSFAGIAAVAVIAFTADGKLLISEDIANQNSPRLWDLPAAAAAPATLPVEYHLRAERRALSPDASRIALGRQDDATVWEVADGKKLQIFKHGGLECRVAFSPDGKRVAVASLLQFEKGEARPAEITIYDLASGEKQATFSIPLKMIHELRFVPGGKALATTSGRDLNLWDLATGTELAHVATATPIRFSAWSPDGSLVVAGFQADEKQPLSGADEVLKLWDVRFTIGPKSPPGVTTPSKAVSTPTPTQFVPRRAKLPAEVEITVRGSWFERPADKPNAEWERKGEIPGKVLVQPGHVYRLSTAPRSPAESEGLSRLSGFPVQELVLDGPVNAKEVGMLLGLDWPELRVLHLPVCDEKGAGPALAGLRKVPGLQSLHLPFWKELTDADLAHLKSVLMLRDLNLQGCKKLTSAGLAPLAGLQHLETLNLQHCDFAAGAGLAHLKALNQLRVLSLSGSDLTDEGLAPLADLPLKELDLTFCKITDASLPHLKKMTQLRLLRLAFCQKFTKAAEAELRRTLPGCKIEINPDRP